MIRQTVHHHNKPQAKLSAKQNLGNDLDLPPRYKRGCETFSTLSRQQLSNCVQFRFCQPTARAGVFRVVTNNLPGSKFIHELCTHVFNLDHLALVKIYFSLFPFYFKSLQNGSIWLFSPSKRFIRTPFRASAR